MECTIYLAEGCNLKCTYCYEGIDKKTGKMDIRTFDQTLAFIMKNRVENDKIHIVFLGGEPLLNKPLFFYAINKINSNYKEIRDQFKLEMTTNGVFLDDNVIKVVKEENINLSLSIDGEEHTQKRNRRSVYGDDTFSTISKNLQKLIEQQVMFNVRMTVTCNNVEDMYNNVCYFLERGVNRIYIAYNYFDNWDEIKLKILHEQMELLDSLYIHNIALTGCKVINLYDFKYTTFLAKRPIVFCSAGTTGHFVVNTEGDIYPCGYVANDEDWKIGTVWTGIEKKKFMFKVEKSVKKIHECQKCEKAFTCMSTRCGFLNYKASGWLNKPDVPICKLEQVLYWHNLKVFNALYQNKCPRLLEYVEIAKQYQLEPNDCVKYMIEE